MASGATSPSPSSLFIVLIVMTGARASSAGVLVPNILARPLQESHVMEMSIITMTMTMTMAFTVLPNQESSMGRSEEEVRGEEHCPLAHGVGQGTAWHPRQLPQILDVYRISIDNGPWTHRYLGPDISVICNCSSHGVRLFILPHVS